MKSLTRETRNSLRSGVAIASFSQCVDELVLNSLDAGATCVAVRIDLSQGKVQVVDNGRGILQHDLSTICERYHTSKCGNMDDVRKNLQHYGYRGEALASIRHMCFMLEIETRAKGSTTTYTQIFRESKNATLHEGRVQRPSAGTTVQVYDLFYAMPVRKKGLNESLEFERVRQRLEAIALIHPRISFSLRNDQSSTKVLQTHKANSVVGAFSHLFGNGKGRVLSEANHEHGPFKVNGYIGQESHHNKALQFVYINQRLVLKTKIHKQVQQLLTKTIILKKKLAVEKLEVKRDRTSPTEMSPRRYAEKHAIFVLNIACPLSAYDITFDPAKTLVEFKNWEEVLKCVKMAVDTFIDKHNLRNIDSPHYVTSHVSSSPIVIEDSQESQAELTDCGRIIDTADVANSLHSETVYRKRKLVSEIVASTSCDKKMDSNTKKDKTAHNEDVSPVLQAATRKTPNDIPGKSIVDVLQSKSRCQMSESTELFNLSKSNHTNCLSEELGKYSNRKDDSIYMNQSATNKHITTETSERDVGYDDSEFEDAGNNIPLLPGQPLKLNSQPRNDDSSCESSGQKLQDKRKNVSISSMVISPNMASNSKSTISNEQMTKQKFVLPARISCSSETSQIVHANEDPLADSAILPSTSSSKKQKQDLDKANFLLSSQTRKSILDSLQAMRARFKAKNSNKQNSNIGTPTFKKHADTSKHKKISLNSKVDEECTASLSFKTVHVEKMGNQILKNSQNSHSYYETQKPTTVHEARNDSNFPGHDKQEIDAGGATPAFSNDRYVSSDINTETDVRNMSHVRDSFHEPCIKPTLTLNDTRKRYSNMADADSISTKLAKLSKVSPLYNLSNNPPHASHYSRSQESTARSGESSQDENWATFRKSRCARNYMSMTDFSCTPDEFDFNKALESLENSQDSQSSHHSHSSKIFAEQDTHSSKNHPQGKSSSRHTPILQRISPLTAGNSLSKPVSRLQRDIIMLTDVNSPTDLSPRSYEVPFSMKFPSFEEMEQLNKVNEQERQVKTSDLRCNDSSLDSEDIKGDGSVNLQNESEKFLHDIESTKPSPLRNQNKVLETTPCGDYDVQYIPLSQVEGIEFRATRPMKRSETLKRSKSAPNLIHEDDNSAFSLSKQNFTGHKIHSNISSSQGFSAVNNHEITQPFHPGIEATQHFAPHCSSGDTDSNVLTHKKYSQNITYTNTELDKSESSREDDSVIDCTDSAPHYSKLIDSISSNTEIIRKCREDSNVFNRQSCEPDVKNSTNSCALIPDIVDKSRIDLEADDSEIVDIGQDWVRKTDPQSGRRIYVNLKSGNSSYDPPLRTETAGSVMIHGRNKVRLLTSNSGPFLGKPKVSTLGKHKKQVPTLSASNPNASSISGLIDDHLEEEGEQDRVKWRKQEDISRGDDSCERTGLSRLLSNWENPAFTISEPAGVNIEISGRDCQAQRVHSVVNPINFTKDMLQSVKVLGQIDKKFIACVVNTDTNKSNRSAAGEVLIVIDQHAAHERVRLEQITNNVYSDAERKQILTCAVTPPVQLSLAEHYIRVMVAHRAHMSRCGIDFKTEDRDTISVHNVPATFVERDLSESNKFCHPAYLPTQLELLVKEQVDVLEKTRGGSSILPHTIHKILCSRACKGAIKFGDEMTVDECEELIGQLSRCHLPFQCAHGRPSLMPLLNIDQLNKAGPSQEATKPRLWRLKKSG